MAKKTKNEWRDVAGFYWRNDFEIGVYVEISRELAKNKAEAETLFARLENTLSFVLTSLWAGSYLLTLDGKRLRLEYFDNKGKGKSGFRVRPGLPADEDSPVRFNIGKPTSDKESG